MTAKLDKIHEMYKLLNEKERVNHDIMSTFGRFGLSQTLRRLGLEKQQGVSALQLIISLCLFRFNGESIFGMYRKDFHSLVETGKNCYYRMMGREGMDWRRLLLRMCVRFFAILRKEHAEETEQPRCYIVDDTTLEKTGISIEGISRVFDHVKHKCVLGFKELILAYFDGRTTIPVDFSLHREKGKEKNYGLSDEERERQFSKSRDENNPDHVRYRELDMKKTDCAVAMMQRAWKAGLRASYALCDSWFTCEEFIHSVRSIGDGSVHFLGMGKMDSKRYYVHGFHQNVYEMISRYERREARKMPKYNSRYFIVNGFLGKEIVRIFFIKYGNNQNWNIIITTDMTMNITKCFETYQIRWSIEVLVKESKRYLGLGRYQGRDFDGQVADCTLCHMTYIALALDKRLNEYETMGALFEQQRADLMALTLWQRLLAIIKHLLEVLADVLGVTYEELSASIVRDEKMLEKYIVMAEALEKLDEAA
jgi:hypothetical protein